MSSLALFALGTGVTFEVASALGLLVAGAVLDGREQAVRRRQNDEAPATRTVAMAPLRVVHARAQTHPIPTQRGETA